MATLQSPGVSVTVVDESFYSPAGAGTVPMIFVATEQDKANGSGTGTAQGTTAANAGKVWVITSQRDLSDTFGVPYFETDAEGNPVHGGELNEYGLQAAYSALGVSSKAYVVRADVDTAQLTPAATAPSGAIVNGTYWLVTADSTFGIQEWNASTGKFTTKTPLIIDNSNMETALSSGTPVSGFGSIGDYAVVVTSDNDATMRQGIFYKSSQHGWVTVDSGFDGGKVVRLSPHYDYPDFTNSGLAAITGSVWINTTSPANGSAWDIRKYSSSSDTWATQSAPLYASTQEAIAELDSVTGGQGIAVGSLFVEYDPTRENKSEFIVWIRYSSGQSSITVPATTPYAFNWQFTVQETDATGVLGSAVNIGDGSSNASNSVALGQMIANDINNSALQYTKAKYDSVTGMLTVYHTLGGDVALEQKVNQPLTTGLQLGSSTAGVYVSHISTSTDYVISNWKSLVYEALPVEPTTAPNDGQQWYDSNLDVDIMYNNGTAWIGYKTAFSGTDPMGPTVSASAPTTHQDGVTSLANGDIWVSTATPNEYGRNIYVYDGSTWNLVDVTDHVTPEGWVFADARWGLTGADDMPAAISDLLVSSYVDPDCPDPRLYPRGTRLFNTRRSGNNVKKYEANYIDIYASNARYNNESMVSYDPGRWVTASPNAADGVGQFGRMAQRSVVVKALQSTVTENTAIRDTDTLVFNLIACPGYPELMQDMVAFNTDRGLTALVLGDTPFRLAANGTDLTNYGNNTAGALDNNDEAAVTYDTQLAMFYPSGYTNDNLGNKIVVPPSHAMLRTILNSDNKSYPWFAPAGTRRGVVDNVTSVGYVDSVTGEFTTASLHQGLRDVLAGVKINPIATLPGVGIVNMGQYTRTSTASALDRINVSRLVAYLRYQLAVLVKPFLFEPNDAQTRHEVKSAVDALLSELVSQRALYDFLTVCDSTNNTPTRIDQNELWVDIAIEPVKSVEFIYIPLRIMNTGAIAALNK